MVKLLFFAATMAASSAHAGDICASVANVAHEAAAARLRGVTYAQAAAEVRAVGDADAREAAGAILWLVYVGNADKHMQPIEVAGQVRDACTASTDH